MGIMEGFEYFAVGIVVLLVLFAFLSNISPMYITSGMDENSKLMLGLIGFTTSAGLVVQGFRKMFEPDKRVGGYEV